MGVMVDVLQSTTVKELKSVLHEAPPCLRADKNPRLRPSTPMTLAFLENHPNQQCHQKQPDRQASDQAARQRIGQQHPGNGAQHIVPAAAEAAIDKEE